MSAHILFLAKNDMDVNERLDNSTFRHKFEVITILHFSHS